MYNWMVDHMVKLKSWENASMALKLKSSSKWQQRSHFADWYSIPRFRFWEWFLHIIDTFGQLCCDVRIVWVWFLYQRNLWSLENITNNQNMTFRWFLAILELLKAKLWSQRLSKRSFLDFLDIPRFRFWEWFLHIVDTFGQLCCDIHIVWVWFLY